MLFFRISGKMIGEKRVKIGICYLFASCFVLTRTDDEGGVSVSLSVYTKSVSILLNVQLYKKDEDRKSVLCLCVIL